MNTGKEHEHHALEALESPLREQRETSLPPLPEDTGALPSAWRIPLRDSLARFQLGEAGEGRIAHQINGVSLPGIDDDYRAALRLFVKEEGRHGRILGHMVRALGGRTLHHTWTERLFVLARRLMGVRLKLLVLLAAEVIGIGFYGLLAEQLPPGALRSGLEQISGDEDLHLRFHCDFFRTQVTSRWRAWLFQWLWQSVGGAAALVVLLDHRCTLKALGIPLQTAARRLHRLIAGASAQVTASPARLLPSSGPAASAGPARPDGISR